MPTPPPPLLVPTSRRAAPEDGDDDDDDDEEDEDDEDEDDGAPDPDTGPSAGTRALVRESPSTMTRMPTHCRGRSCRPKITQENTAVYLFKGLGTYRRGGRRDEEAWRESEKGVRTYESEKDECVTLGPLMV